MVEYLDELLDGNLSPAVKNTIRQWLQEWID
jgi:hypothetical protein